METVLVDQLVDHSTPKHSDQKGWTKEAWRVITEGFNTHFLGLRLSIVQIKQHEQTLKKRYNIILKMSTYSRMGWNPDNNIFFYLKVLHPLRFKPAIPQLE